MEFFRIADIRTSEEELQQKITIGTLDAFCASIEEVFEDKGATGRAYTLWGDFRINREPIKGGVRFTFPECPNMLAWTVTTGYDPAPESVLFHCTIARPTHDPDFVESLDEFADDWQKGLQNGWSSI